MANKIRKDDEVIVIAGKDKGKRGKVLRIVENRVWVESANLIKKHQKPNPQKNVQGGIIDKEASLHISNVAIFNATAKKADRVGFKKLKDGKKVRYFKSNDETIDM